ncbi:MAG: HAMP domain-containing protein, partial [Actinomyces sp.]
MIRDRSIRTKLALIVLGPVLVMVALGTAVVRPALAEVGDTDRSARLAEFVLASMQYRDQVEHERFDSIALTGGAAMVTPDALAAQRAETDAARSHLLDVAESTAITSFEADIADKARAVLDAAAGLDALRADVDAGTLQDPHAVDDAFRDLLAPQQDLQVILRSAGQAELVRAGDAITAYYDAEEAFSDLGAFVGAGLHQGMSPEDRRQAVALEHLEEAQFDRFGLIGDPAQAAALRTILDSDLHEQFETMLDTTVGSLTGSLAATPDEWWPVVSDFFDVINELEEEVFVSFVDQAAATHDAARSDALLAGGASALAAVVALAVAFGFGRRLATRVRRLSEEAHEAAAERLPAVLAEVGEVDADEIADHLPTVAIDGRDEIGTLADSFNAVLQTAVETSIDHVQKRAEAMTRVLTSLGRRNQALIERQLGILDGLEARVEDDEILDGLFRIDHMITRLRRNSENLLVLASDRPARNWSRPVPLLDVVRGALAEVDDLSRVDIDLAGVATHTVVGSRAVDLSHILAELIDNALAYSPPTEPVAIRASAGRDSVRLWVIDRGVGMSPDELDDANHRISSATDITEVETDRIGFQVVGRLAQRVGVTVAIQPNPGGGLAASVDLPDDIFDRGQPEETSPLAVDTPATPAATPAP